MVFVWTLATLECLSLRGKIGHFRGFEGFEGFSVIPAKTRFWP
jgi:hypothetical protein